MFYSVANFLKGKRAFVNKLICSRINPTGNLLGRNNARYFYTSSTLKQNKDPNLFSYLIGPHVQHPQGAGNLYISGSSVLGLGCLCGYGLAVKSKIIESKHPKWAAYVQERIRSTYAFFGASVLWTTAAAVVAFSSKHFLKLLMTNSWIIMTLSLTAQVISGITVLHMDYEPGLSLKHLIWILHSVIWGVTIAPMCFIGGAVLVRAFWMTGGVILGLSAVACCAPEAFFLGWSAPLASGLGYTALSTLGSFVFPATTNLGLNWFSLYLYGGLIFFSIMLLHDTQRVIKEAKTVPHTEVYDPINSALGLYMNALNVFVRLVQKYIIQEVRKHLYKEDEDSK